MPVLTDAPAGNRRSLRWAAALVLALTLLLLAAVGFLAWLPGRGYNGLSLGGGVLESGLRPSYIGPASNRQGFSQWHSAEIDIVELRIGDLRYGLDWHPDGKAWRIYLRKFHLSP
jgi:hypothetical protein